MFEVVITVGNASEQDRDGFLARLSKFLRMESPALNLSEPEVFFLSPPVPESTKEETEELALSYNWVSSCRIPPSTEDEF